jgi:hypothetical protein
MNIMKDLLVHQGDAEEDHLELNEDPKASKKKQGDPKDYKLVLQEIGEYHSNSFSDVLA